MKPEDKKEVLLLHTFRKNGIRRLILTNQYLIYEKETSDGVLSKEQEVIFQIPLADIQDVWRHVGLIASTLIVEVKSSEKQLNKFEFKMDDATCQKWADTLSDLIGC
jgi:hypothetical protein